MAYFGWPEAHENDAERAARASLAILDAVSKLNEHPTHPKLSARIGIDSGAVVVGAGAGKDTDVFGDTPNIAARVQAAPALARSLGHKRVESPTGTEKCAGDFRQKQNQSKRASDCSGTTSEDVDPVSLMHCTSGQRDKTQKHIETHAEDDDRNKHSTAQKYQRREGNQRHTLRCREEVDARDDPNPRGPPACATLLFITQRLERIGHGLDCFGSLSDYRTAVARARPRPPSPADRRAWTETPALW